MNPIYKSNLVSLSEIISNVLESRINSMKEKIDKAELMLLDNSIEDETVVGNMRKQMLEMYLHANRGYKDDFHELFYVCNVLSSYNKNFRDLTGKALNLSLKLCDKMMEIRETNKAKALKAEQERILAARAERYRTSSEPIITNAVVRIEKGYVGGVGFVDVTYHNGTSETIFSFYPDEIFFTETELIDKTRSQAFKLYTEKDVAYLRS